MSCLPFMPPIFPIETVPRVVAQAISDGPHANAPHPIALPAGIRRGDLIIIFFGTFEVLLNRNFWYPPAGFIEISEVVNAWRQYCWYKIADGNESTQVIANREGNGTVSGSSSNVFVIRGHKGVPVAYPMAHTSNAPTNAVVPGTPLLPTLALASVIKGDLTGVPAGWTVGARGINPYSSAYATFINKPVTTGVWSASSSTQWMTTIALVRGQ